MARKIFTINKARKSAKFANFTTKCLVFVALLSLLSGSLFNLAQAQNPINTLIYKDANRPAEDRAKDLVARMTLEEKAAQVIHDAPAIPRLGVREYNWWNEGLHGVAAAGHATVFPQAIGMAATWDSPLIEKVADTVSVEFRAKYLKEQHRFGGSDWFRGLTVWSPNINIFRDPRWGRGQETYGEDPYLTARMGVAYVKGLQGYDEHYLRTVATPKHFAVHSGPESSRHSDNYAASPFDLEDTYLPAFRATVIDGQAVSVMCAYNAINGHPACANEMLMVNRLRQTWGFSGYVVTDCGAINDFYASHGHHYRASSEESVAAAFGMGTDIICGDATDADSIVASVKSGQLKEAQLDAAVVRLFTARFRLGQFDAPSRVFPNITAQDYDTSEHRALSLQTAQASLVLLKNDHQLLPLKAEPRSIAVIGPNADTVDSLVGNYNGEPSQPTTILSGLKARYPNANITYVQGTGLIDPVMAPVPDDNICLDRECVQKGVKASFFDTPDLSGEVASETTQKNARFSWSKTLLNSSVRYEGYLVAPESGEYHLRYLAHGGYRIWVDGQLIVDAWAVDWRPAIISGRVTLEAGKKYALKVEAFQRQVNGDEKLVWSLPSDQAAAKAVDAAKSADLVVFVAGYTQQLEGEEMRFKIDGFAGGDRTSLDLPKVQQSLLERVQATGKPVVLVLINGSAVSVNWADQHIPAIIEAWYPGGQGGDAVAGLIAGDFSPSGRLPITFYRSVEQLPPFKDYGMKGRTYRYFSGEALYPFGYGLSYADFGYDDLTVSKKVIDGSESLTVSVKVSNLSQVDAAEVVQLYVSHPQFKDGPITALKGFERVFLKAGETKTVTFTLSPYALSTVHSDGARKVKPGSVSLFVGGGQPKTRKGLKPTKGKAITVRIKSAFEIDQKAFQ